MGEGSLEMDYWGSSSFGSQPSRPPGGAAAAATATAVAVTALSMVVDAAVEVEAASAPVAGPGNDKWLVCTEAHASVRSDGCALDAAESAGVEAVRPGGDGCE